MNRIMAFSYITKSELARIGSIKSTIFYKRCIDALLQDRALGLSDGIRNGISVHVFCAQYKHHFL
jgi:hypothetical protein